MGIPRAPTSRRSSGRVEARTCSEPASPAGRAMRRAPRTRSSSCNLIAEPPCRWPVSPRPPAWTFVPDFHARWHGIQTIRHLEASRRRSRPVVGAAGGTGEWRTVTARTWTVPRQMSQRNPPQGRSLGAPPYTRQTHPGRCPMPEDLNVEVAGALAEGGSARTSPRNPRWEELVEILEAILLAAVAIATAWSGY